MATSVYFLLLLLQALTLNCSARPGLDPSSQSQLNITTNNNSSEVALQCNSCRDVVGFTQRLFDTSDLKELKNNLTSWCVSLGHGTNDHWCRIYVEDGLSALDRVGSSYFCERVHVCPETSALAANALQQNRDNTKCDFCIKVVTSLKEIVASPETENEFKECLGNACLHIGALKDECVELVDKNLDALFTYLRERMNPRQVCKSTGYCVASDAGERQAASFEEFVNLGPVDLAAGPSPAAHVIPLQTISPAMKVSKPDPVRCLMCKHIVTDVMKRIKDNKTEQAIVQALDGICSRIFSKDKELHQCEKFVKEYTDEAIQIIVQENDPKRICQMLDVCAHKISDSGEDDVTDLNEGKYCHQCQIASSWIFEKVKQSTEDKVLNDTLAMVCTRALPVSESENCLAFIEGKAEWLKSLIRSHNDSLALCKEIELCSLPTRGDLERETEVEPVEPVERGPHAPIPTCFVCKKIVSWIHQQLKGNRSEEAIENALAAVCHHLKDVEKCEEKTQLWSRQIMTALRIGTEPEVVCITLGECAISKGHEASENEVELDVESKTERPVETVTEYNNLQGGVCYECQMVAHFIQRELYDYEKEKRIEDFVIDNICSKVKDETTRQTCESFVNEYGPAILQLISQKAFDPKVLCQNELRLCPKIHPTPPPAVIEPKMDIELTNASNNQLCNICEQSVRQLDSVLTTIAATEKESEKVLSQVCSHFIEQKKQQCEQIMQAFGAHLQQLIGRLSNPNEVCRSIDLCYQVGQLHLLGGHKCTFGPTYWCYTAAHAESCKATQYCKSNVWKAVEQAIH